MNNNRNILLIGVGGIGSRHLQALSKLHNAATIYVVDPSEKSIQHAQEIVGKTEKEIHYAKSILEVPSEIYLTIVAVTSGIRRKVTEELLSAKLVKYIIFEKVLFTKIEDYTVIKKLLDEKKVTAWVDCTRREWDFYKVLKPAFKEAQSIELTVIGTNWGLGCNSIHELDLLSYLSASNDVATVDISGLDKNIIPSKRPGYVEFTGTLKGQLGHNAFSFTSAANEVESIKIINSDVCNAVIHEGTDTITATISKINHGIELSKENVTYPMQYISCLTNLMVDKIIETGSCLLPSYEESMQLHLPLINAFLKKIIDENGYTDTCNIT